MMSIEQLREMSPQKGKKTFGNQTIAMVMERIETKNATIGKWIVGNRLERVEGVGGKELVEAISLLSYLLRKRDKEYLKVYTHDLELNTEFLLYPLNDLGLHEIPFTVDLEGKFSQRRSMDINEFKVNRSDKKTELSSWSHLVKSKTPSQVSFYSSKNYFDDNVKDFCDKMGVEYKGTLESELEGIFVFIEDYVITRGCEEATISTHSINQFLKGTFGLETKTENQQAFRTMYPRILREQSRNIIHNWKKGGLVQANKMYIGQELTCGGTHIDVHNMYGGVMCQDKLPVGVPKLFSMPTIEQIQKYTSDPFKYVVLNIGYDEVKNKNPKDNNEWIISTDRVIYGERKEVVLSYEEFREINKLTSFITDGEEGYIIYDMLVFEAEYCFFKDFFKSNYEDKLRATIEGDRATKQYAKLLNNSVTGMIGFNVDKGVFKGYIENGFQKQKRMGFNHNEFEKYSYALYSAITSNARVRLLKVITTIGVERFLYCDTDSVCSTCSFEELRELGIELDEEQIGCWGLELEWTRAKIFGKKAYALIDDRSGEEKRAFSGYLEEDINKIPFNDLCNGCKIKSKRRVKVYGGFYYEDIVYSLCVL